MNPVTCNSPEFGALFLTSLKLSFLCLLWNYELTFIFYGNKMETSSSVYVSLWGEKCWVTGAAYRSVPISTCLELVLVSWLSSDCSCLQQQDAVTEDAWLTWNKWHWSHFCSCWDVKCCALAIVSVTVSSPNPCSVNCVCAGRGVQFCFIFFPFHVILKQLPSVVLKVAM